MAADPRSQVLDLFSLAIADGFVSPEELTVIYEKGTELGLKPSHVDEVLRDPYGVEFQPPTSLVDAITRLYDCARVVISDGVIHPKEVELLRSFARKFQMKEALIEKTIDAILAEVQAGTSRESLIESLQEELA